MLKFLAWRLAALVPLVLAVSVIAFGLVVALEWRVGSIAEYILEEGAADPAAVAALERELGLDQPLLVRFGNWIWSAAHLDFGHSLLRPAVSVTDLVATRAGVTASLMVFALLIAVGIGILLGIFSAVSPGGRMDRAISVLSAVLMSAPSFVIGLMLMIVFGATLRWFTPTGYVPLRMGLLPWLGSATLPATAIALPIVAVIQRQLRSSMTNALLSPYVLAARARGVPRRMIIRRHALPNAMIPTVTVIGFSAASAIGLTTAVELVFNLPGLGSLLVDSIMRRDVTVVQGCLVAAAILVVVINLLVDVSYGWLNPKVRLG